MLTMVSTKYYGHEKTKKTILHTSTTYPMKHTSADILVSRKLNAVANKTCLCPEVHFSLENVLPHLRICRMKGKP